ncbi:hypothetical protein TRFO_19372 [Tritrichomonas foetus]|uniref:TOG domain-containing protein n=1 Tax=Tritrichomonas foetus TaxID=1144522 RepID=A0A1J4KIV3_9EUKA|nr:hypothetical protein TRFO_19372 [Tritrichomonas foetus]|eukprot:OHT11271.1 hypothetical protein TRFO_19372 [Tritrichomonas foetus]
MRKQKDELLSLEKQFEDPLKDVESRPVDSAIDVEDIIADLEIKLENTSDDWNIRNDALLEAMEYLKGGIATYPVCDFSRLASGIASCVGDLRSALVKRGSLLVAACSLSFGKDFLSSIDIIVPALFKQLSHGTAVIANSARLALRSIVRYVQNRRTSRLFLSKMQTKSNIQRVVIAESIKIMREEWSPQLIDGIDSELMNALKIYSEDASAEVRSIAKQAMSFQPTPTKKSHLKSPRASLTPTSGNDKKVVTRKSSTPVMQSRIKTPTRKFVGRHISQPKEEDIIEVEKHTKVENDENIENLPPQKPVKKVLFGPPKAKDPPPEEISEYMPPRTRAEAKSFLRMLNDILVQKNYDNIVGLEELLAPSLISATHVMPQSELYMKVLPELFNKYTEEFSVQVHDLLIAFNFDPQLLAEAVNVYGEQQIAETFVGKRDNEENESVRFFITLFSHKYEINITPKMRQFLLKLIQNFRTSMNVRIIEEAIKIPETDSNLNKIVDQLIQKIKSQKKWLPLYQQLVVQLSSNTLQTEYLDMIQDRLVSQFTDILTQGTQAQCHEIRSFLITGAMNCRGISFAKLAEPMLPLIMNENRIEREKTEECYQILLNDPQTITLLIEILQNDESEEKAHAVLSIILQYVTKSTLRQISAILPHVVDILASLIKSEVVGVRRLSILILVEFKCKVPKEFMPYFKKLTIAHQKLINLYSNKRG